MNRNNNGDGDEHGDESSKEGGDGKKKLNKQKQNRKGCLDLQDSFGQTPLHLASLRGNVEVVEYILDQAEMLGLQYGPSGRFRAGYHWRHRGLCSRDVEF